MYRKNFIGTLLLFNVFCFVKDLEENFLTSLLLFKYLMLFLIYFVPHGMGGCQSSGLPRVGVGIPGVVWVWYLLLELCSGTYGRFLLGIKLT